MRWHYAIVDNSSQNGGDPWFEIAEVYHTKDGSGTSSVNNVGCETPEGVIEVLEMMLADARRHGVYKTGI